MAYGRKKPTTIAELRRALVEDSIERKKLVDKLVQAVRIDEREKVLSITERTRERAAER